MGIAERKEREKKEMRQLILDTATRMFRTEGFENTSVRKIAREIEYSAGSIYLHFKNKDEIFYAIHAEYFNMLYARFEALHTIENPLERLRTLGREFMKFGFENPEGYDLMFVNQSPMEKIEHEENWFCAMRTFEALVDTVQACIDQGYFPNKNLMQLVMIAYGTAHGIITLHNHRHMKMFPEEYHESLLNDTMDYVLELLQKP